MHPQTPMYSLANLIMLNSPRRSPATNRALKDNASNQRYWHTAKTCKLIGTEASVRAEDTVLVVLIVDGFRWLNLTADGIIGPASHGSKVR